MENLNLKKVWEICNLLQARIEYLAEEDTYVHLLGYNSEYSIRSFESFLEYYSFKIEDSKVIIYNDDGVPYETYTNNDFSYIPICLLSFLAEEIENWMKDEVERQLKQQEEDRLVKKENLKREIERLNKQYNK